MGIFDRFSTLLRSNINDLISRAEDPEKMLTQILVDMRGAAREGQAAGRRRPSPTRSVCATRPTPSSSRRRTGSRSAMLAVQEGRDDLAKQALVRQGEHIVARRSSSSRRGKQHRLETEKLKNSLRDLNDKIEEAKRKKNLLVARQRRAQAQKRIAETMSSMSEKSAFEAFARMEERIETNERQLKASVEIEEEFTGDRLRAGLQAAREGRRRRHGRHAAARAQAEDGHAPCRSHRQARRSAPGSVMKRPSTPRSRNPEREEEPLSD